MQVNFTIPNFFDVSTQSYVIAALLFLAALLSITVTSIYKKHYVKKKDVKLAKHWVGLWVAASNAFFTYLGWLVVFASANVSFLSGLPYVGKYVLSAIGLSYALYNIRLSKVYQSIVHGLTKWSKSDDKEISPFGAGVTTAVTVPQGDDREFKLPE